MAQYWRARRQILNIVLRFAVVDDASVDSRRRLILVRRDNIEIITSDWRGEARGANPPRQRVDRHARLQLVEKVGPSVGETDRVARIDSENGRQVGVVDAELHSLLGRWDHVHAAFTLMSGRGLAGFVCSRKLAEPGANCR
jgi:hypothetical protein